MFTAGKKGRIAVIGAIAVSAAIALAGCSSSSSTPLGSSASASAGTIVIGSQAYYSNEIIAEIYAQALEANGQTVTRQFNIGQRDAYLPSVENGTITLFPEYTGNLLQYLDKTATATTSADVYAALQKAVPDNLTVLDQAPAADQDAYVVTKAFSDANGVTSIADLAKVPNLTLGANQEFSTRPYGPTGALSTYGVTLGFTPINDSGGPLTVQALQNNTVQVADIYTSSSAITKDNLVVLSDPKGLILASNVVPLINKAAATPEVTSVINKVDAALTSSELAALNDESTVDQKSSADIAKAWLAKEKLF
ncbi:ABC transporter substrate-binding protein [Subtercola lobariae]|uniref:Glycine/betaine ABC transporter permease n=1 Tax=Subtercola lobariae TaxID=1588641 RepID=A0A917F421_9MICO|nr:ABC transporter substrate-binding protein [Subtercola lobariae]GGF40527.1 glycine/betaine ABC transporter permease [Subtercola lobariae]